MIAVAAHEDPEVRAAISSVLEQAGWSMHAAATADEAIDACGREGADVLLLGTGLGGVPTLEVLDRVKRDPDLFRVAVVIAGHGLDVTETVSALDRGADDVLRLPVDDADLVARAFAAARTKALVEELTAQNNRLEELVFFDELTGLRNRRATLQELEMLLAGARRHGHELSVLMLDVDSFKPINDRYGHRAGDEVLREVARRVAGRLRQADFAGRLGGDEMLVVLPDTNAEGAQVLAESIRHAISCEPVRTSAGLIRVTMSMGSAQWSDEDLPRLLEQADGALYAAKAAGRDCSVAA